MTAILADIYLWVKALHVIAVVAWMAGLFYLPRLYVYHVEQVTKGSETDLMFQVMERRLLKAIMNPAMIVTWIFGLALVMTPGIVDWSMVWPWTSRAKSVRVFTIVSRTTSGPWLLRPCGRDRRARPQRVA